MTSIADRIFEYETEGLSDEDTLELFCDLLNTGMISHLQGAYHRAAGRLIGSRAIVLHPENDDLWIVSEGS